LCKIVLGMMFRFAVGDNRRFVIAIIRRDLDLIVD